MHRRHCLQWAGAFGVVLTLSAGAARLVARDAKAFAQTSPSAFRLASLTGARDAATLEYTSQGCFHGAVYRLDFASTPTPRLKVTDQNTAKRLGVVTLTTEQVNRLDNTLRFFREHGRGGGCTTRDTLNITIFRDGRASGRETLEDDTCRRSVLEEAHGQDFHALRQYPEWKRFAPDAAPILSLDRVIALAGTTNQHGLATIAYAEAPRTETKAYATLREKQAEAATQRRAERMARDLPGYEAMRRRFKVDGTDLGNINLLPYSLYVKVSATTPRLIEASRWFNPVNKGKPQYNWKQFLQAHDMVERSVARHRWVSEWKKAGPGRTVESHLFGITPIEEQKPEWYVNPAWKHAGLRGLPRYEVTLRRDDDTWLTAYFGDQDARALVDWAKPPKATKPLFWLDTFDFHYHPRQDVPNYVVVAPDGTWRRNLRRDERTPAWFLAEARK